MPSEVRSLPFLSRAGALSFVQKSKAYFSLGKPGIAFSVLITTFAGYMAGLSVRPDAAFSPSTLFHTLLGTFCVSMGAGALNMLLENDSDALMDRTKDRPIPSGKVPAHHAFLLGGFIASFGVAHLAATSNLRAAFAAGISLVLYLVFYTPMKKSSRASTAVGAVAGALPPIIGWNAAGAAFGWNAASLFAILFLWQFPHFLALFFLYRSDFARAGIRTLFPADEDGRRTAKAVQILSVALAALSALPLALGLGGPAYVGVASLLNGYLIFSAFRFARKSDASGARQYFLATVIYLPLLFLALAFRI